MLNFVAMKIGINARFLLKGKMEGFGWYTFEIAKRLVEKHPEHDFVFFFDRTFDPQFVFAKNVEAVVLFPPARHPILFKWFFDYSIKRALKKYRIDVFFSPDGYLCLRTNVPQVASIHDLNFEHFPEDLPSAPRNYLRNYFPKFAKKALEIITVSEFSKQDIAKTYNIQPAKITVVWNGVNEKYKAVPNEKKQIIQAEIANGNAYFLFVGALHKRKNLKTLLEAFEVFQQTNSSIDLVIVGSELWKHEGENFPELSSEAKERIHFTGHLPLEKLVEITGAAHALTFVSYFEGFGIPVAEAMKCGVPVIAGNRTSLPEVVGDAGILVDPMNVTEIVAAMNLLATDKIVWNELSQKGLERSKDFSWDKAANVVYSAIERCSK